MFTAKELDEETGLYYFGARYYDPRTSVWQSPDPATKGYLNGGSSGGVYSPRNLSAYSYGGQNPVRVTDPSGLILDTVLDVGFVIYDLGALAWDEAFNEGRNRNENLLALGADVAGIFVPIGTGGGIAVRSADNIASGGVRATRTLDEIAPNGRIPRGREFEQWFDDLSVEELDLVLADNNLSQRLARRYRDPGGLHKWCMVCEVRQFKEWGVSMSEMRRFRTRIDELDWRVPGTGELGGHGSKGSTGFHNELRDLIQNSGSLDEFNSGLGQLIDRWNIDPAVVPRLIDE